MNARMEKVAQDVALRALLKSVSAVQPPLQVEQLKEAFRAEWPLPDSDTPMNDAMLAVAQAVGKCSGQGVDAWKTAVSQEWQPAVEEVVEEYFKSANDGLSHLMTLSILSRNSGIKYPAMLLSRQKQARPPRRRP